MFTGIPYFFNRNVLPEVNDKIERQKADESNKQYYSRLFKELSDKLSDKWYIQTVKHGFGYGGTIYAVYKEFPNVYMVLNPEYIDANTSVNVFKELKLYIDDSHFSSLNIPMLNLLNNIDIIDESINNMITTYSPGLKEYQPHKLRNHLFFNTGKEYLYMDLYHIKKFNLKDGGIQMYFTDADPDFYNNHIVVSTSYIADIPYVTKMIIRIIQYNLEHPYVIEKKEEVKNVGLFSKLKSLFHGK